MFDLEQLIKRVMENPVRDLARDLEVGVLQGLIVVLTDEKNTGIDVIKPGLESAIEILFKRLDAIKNPQEKA